MTAASVFISSASGLPNAGPNAFSSIASGATGHISDHQNIMDALWHFDYYLSTSSALASAIKDETGTGVLVFNNSPNFTGTPTINGTAIGSGNAITIQNSGSLVTSAASALNFTGGINISGTGGSVTINVPVGGTASNSASLGGLPDTAYAKLSGANFVSASIGGVAITPGSQGNSSYSASAGISASTSQTNFNVLTVNNATVATVNDVNNLFNGRAQVFYADTPLDASYLASSANVGNYFWVNRSGQLVYENGIPAAPSQANYLWVNNITNNSYDINYLSSYNGGNPIINGVVVIYNSNFVMQGSAVFTPSTAPYTISSATFFSTTASNFNINNDYYTGIYFNNMLGNSIGALSPLSPLVRYNYSTSSSATKVNNVSSSVGTTSLSVSWTPPTSGSISAYLVSLYDPLNIVSNGSYYLHSSSGVSTTSAVNIAIFNNLLSNYKYIYTVEAITAPSNFRGPQEASIVQTLVGTISSAPTSLSALTTQRAGLFYWNSPSFNGNSTINNYLISYSADLGSTWNYVLTNSSSAATLSSPFTLSNLNYGINYYVRIAALNQFGYSANSNIITYSTSAAVPNTPSAPLLSRGNSQFTVLLTPPTDNGASINYYNVVWSTASNFSTITGSGNLNNISSVITGLTNNTTYYIKYLANNAVGNSQYSSFTSVTPTPVALTGLKILAAFYGLNGIAQGNAIISPNASFNSWSSPIIAASGLTPYGFLAQSNGGNYISGDIDSNGLGFFYSEDNALWAYTLDGGSTFNDNSLQYNSSFNSNASFILGEADPNNLKLSINNFPLSGLAYGRIYNRSSMRLVNGYWVMPQQYANTQYWTSPTGSNNPINNTGLASYFVPRDIAYGAGLNSGGVGKYVMVGRGQVSAAPGTAGLMIYSASSLTSGSWTLAASAAPYSGSPVPISASADANCVTFGEGIFVAGGGSILSGPKIYTSLDGTNWFSASTLQGGVTDARQELPIVAVTYGSARFIAWSGSGYYYYAVASAIAASPTNPLNWVKASMYPSPLGGNVVTQNTVIMDARWVKDKFVAVTSSGTIITSASLSSYWPAFYWNEYTPNVNGLTASGLFSALVVGY